MSAVNFYDDYPTILSSKDIRINQLEQVEELQRTKNFWIGSTIVLGTVVVLMGLFYINETFNKRKDD